MPAIWDDLRHAAAALRSRPGYAFAAILTLVLGIGATTAVFSAVNGLLLRELPFRDGERLMHIYARIPKFGDMKVGMSAPDYLELRERTGAIASLGLFENTNGLLGESRDAIMVGRVTPSLFETLGMPPALGRAFREEEAHPGQPPVAMLAYDTWVRRFGADPALVGRTIALDGKQVTVVGVAAAGMTFPERNTAVLVPFGFDPAVRGGDARGQWQGYGVARLAPNATLEMLQAELDSHVAQAREAHPETSFFIDQLGFHLKAESLRDAEVAPLRPGLRLLQFAVLLVLLVAAANLAGLALTRATDRIRELAVRSAMGAGLGRLTRHVLVENLLLAVIGGGLGVGVAVLALGVIEKQGWAPDTAMTALSPDVTVIAVGFSIALITALLAALAPMLWLRRVSLESTLRGEARMAGGGRGTQRVRSTLVVAQLALSTTLAVLVGLLGVSLWRLLAVDPGFVREGVYVARIAPRDPAAKAPARDRDAMLAAIGALPGVSAAGFASCMPFGSCASVSSYAIAGEERSGDTSEYSANNALVDAGYLQTLRIPLKAGRLFAPGDLAEGAGAVVIDEAFAARHFPDGTALGHALDMTTEPGKTYQLQIVGVVGNVRTGDLSKPPSEPTFYTLGREFGDGTNLVVRMAQLEGAQALLRDAVERSDADSTLQGGAWLEQRVRNSVAGRMSPLLLTGAFAALAVVLAAVGVYAVLALAVLRRRAEFGVRAALGANASALSALVLRQGGALLALGLLLGAVGAFAASSFVSSALFGVSRAEPAIYAGALAVLALVGIVACWLPARRAARVDPTVALRAD